MLSREELKLIHAIADRAVALYESLGMLNAHDLIFARSGIAHELMIVHTEVVPLRLQELHDADNFNFAHDIGGIHRHLDPGHGDTRAQLTMCFVPRFAAPTQKVA